MQQSSPVLPRGDRPTVVVATQALPAATLNALDAMADVVSFGASPAQAAPVLITDPGRGVSARMMDGIEGLRLIAVYGVGVDAVDLAAAAARGIVVSNTPGLLTDAVADLALALLLASARGVTAADRYVRDGGWTTHVAQLPLGRGLQGRTLGIVGLGGIGAKVAVRGAAFGLAVAYHGPRAKDVPWRYEADLTALARASDFLVVACPATPQTRGIVDAGVIAALGPQGTLVNVARGSVVDEAALVTALESGALGFAALDVFEGEPKIDPRLRALPNVVLSPHVGSATQDTREAMGRLLLANLAAFFEGRALPTPVALPMPVALP